MKHYAFAEIIERVQTMEAYFDEVQNGLLQSPHCVDKDKLRLLAEYYGDGRWLNDYTLDECGRLPPYLKRAVLSQDGVYNLLQELKDKDLP